MSDLIERLEQAAEALSDKGYFPRNTLYWKAAARIRELEAECDAMEGEYAAIEAATIERCAALFDIEGWGQIMHSEVAKRIRALKLASEENPRSQKSG